MLLQLYSRPFRERFGEGMAQTFQDLCWEHRDTRRGLFGFGLWIFSEALVGIVRENITRMNQLGRTMLRVALVALGLLMVPLVASQVVDGWNWGPGAFVFAYVMFFATGLAYALIARKVGTWAYKAGVLVWRWWPGSPWGGPTWSMSLTRKIRRTWCTSARSLWGASGPGWRNSRRGGWLARRSRCPRRCVDCRATAFGRAAVPCAEYGHPAWCIRGVVRSVRSPVPAREFGGNEVRPQAEYNRPAVSTWPGLAGCL
jgi:hypothetical protein